MNKCHREGCERKIYCRELCKPHYEKYMREKHAADPNSPKCKVPGCERTSMWGHKYCSMHRARLQKTGELRGAETEVGKGSVNKKGYVTVADKHHPLSRPCGTLLEHRKVFYNHSNGICPSCAYCNVKLSWDTIQIDHHNGVRSDNRPENLVPTCARCNTALAYLPYLFSHITADALDLLDDKIDKMLDGEKFKHLWYEARRQENHPHKQPRFIRLNSIREQRKETAAES